MEINFSLNVGTSHKRQMSDKNTKLTMMTQKKRNVDDTLVKIKNSNFKKYTAATKHCHSVLVSLSRIDMLGYNQ